MRFKLGITSKLFLAVVAISIIVVLAMGSAVGIGLRQDYLDYALSVESRRTRWILEELEEVYEDAGSWEFLRAEPQRWDQLNALQRSWDDGIEKEDNRRREGRRDRNRRDDDDDDDQRYPDITGMTARLSLLDADRIYVVGNPAVPADAVMYPIVDEGETVGWLATAPFPGVTDTLELGFQEQQLRTARLIGGASVLLAGVIAWLIARVFISRMQRIARATHDLAAGNYATRIDMRSGDELGELAEDFNRLARTLEKNDQMRRSFMADVAHELRTPLAVLQAEVAAVEDGVRQLTPETLKSLQAEIGTLSKLIEELYQLALSDMGALSYRKTETDIGDVLLTTLDAFQQRFAERSIDLVAPPAEDGELIVLGDPQWLTQLFNNLFDNALRYTDPGGRVEVSCARHHGHVRIDLQDSQPGVPDEALPRLFERLYRVEPSRSRAYGGAGLGLAICKNVVEAHEGTITAQHSPLGGLWITVTLPLSSS